MRSTKKKKQNSEEKTKYCNADVSPLNVMLDDMEGRIREHLKTQINDLSFKMDVLISILAEEYDVPASKLGDTNINGKRCRLENNERRSQLTSPVSDAESTVSDHPQTDLQSPASQTREKEIIQKELADNAVVAAAAAVPVDYSCAKMEVILESVASDEKEECPIQPYPHSVIFDPLGDVGFRDFIDVMLDSDDEMQGGTEVHNVSGDPVQVGDPSCRPMPLQGTQQINLGSVEGEMEQTRTPEMASNFGRASQTERKNSSNRESDNLGGNFGARHCSVDVQKSVGLFHVTNATESKVHPAPVDGYQNDVPEHAHISEITIQHSPVTDEICEVNAAYGPVTAGEVIPDQKPRFSRLKVLVAMIIVLVLVAFIVWPIVVFGQKKKNDKKKHGHNRHVSKLVRGANGDGNIIISQTTPPPSVLNPVHGKKCQYGVGKDGNGCHDEPGGKESNDDPGGNKSNIHDKRLFSKGKKGWVKKPSESSGNGFPAMQVIFDKSSFWCFSEE